VVASSDGVEDCNASIRVSFWIPIPKGCGSHTVPYFGYIRLVELDPKTGKRLNSIEKAPQQCDQQRKPQL